VLSPKVVIGVQKSLMLLVNHILKMAAMLKPSAEYNQRAAIEDLRAERSATKIIWFFGYQDQPLMTLWQNI